MVKFRKDVVIIAGVTLSTAAFIGGAVIGALIVAGVMTMGPVTLGVMSGLAFLSLVGFSVSLIRAFKDVKRGIKELETTKEDKDDPSYANYNIRSDAMFWQEYRKLGTPSNAPLLSAKDNIDDPVWEVKNLKLSAPSTEKKKEEVKHIKFDEKTTRFGYK